MIGRIVQSDNTYGRPVYLLTTNLLLQGAPQIPEIPLISPSASSVASTRQLVNRTVMYCIPGISFYFRQTRNLSLTSMSFIYYTSLSKTLPYQKYLRIVLFDVTALIKILKIVKPKVLHSNIE